MADAVRRAVRSKAGLRSANKRLHSIWTNMKSRCHDKNVPYYSRYGGRGIRICEEWINFDGFLKDMAPSYSNGLSIERIDNSGNYCKENCKWATPKEQALNTRNIDRAKRYLFNGVFKTVRELATEFSIKRTTLDMRLRHYCWSVEKALLTRVH